MSRPSSSMVPPLTSSRPAINRSSVDLPQPDGPTKTTNSLSFTSRSMPLMMEKPSKPFCRFLIFRLAMVVGLRLLFLRSKDRSLRQLLQEIYADTTSRAGAAEGCDLLLFNVHFTAPNDRPRTSCFWLIQPKIRIGAQASVDTADNLAQNRPSGLEYEAISAVSGAAFDEVRFNDQNASFQHRI